MSGAEDPLLTDPDTKIVTFGWILSPVQPVPFCCGHEPMTINCRLVMVSSVEVKEKKLLELQSVLNEPLEIC